MTYARARLWLGISGVGFFVMLSAAALWFALPYRAYRGRSGASAILTTLAVYLVLSVPFDLLGGFLLPRRFNRTKMHLPDFLLAWARGVCVQVVVLGVCAFLILQAAQRGGDVAGTGVFILLMLGLLLGQLPLARMAGGLSRIKNYPALPRQDGPGKQIALNDILVYRSADPAFIGGLIGLPGREKLVLPAAWLETIHRNTLSMQLARRAGVLATGARARGIGLALLWNLVGFLLASHSPHASLTTAPGLITTSLWLTLWSFLGLLLLPSLNRPGVLEGDRFALRQGLDEKTLREGMAELDRLQDDEPERSRWIERVFHPIPSVSRREAALKSGSGTGAWQGARMTLYLSWACFGFLARAVHCNVGRPELWVLFPGD